MMISAEASTGILALRVEREVVGLVERDGGLMNGHVPLDLINDDDVPVDEENLHVIETQLDDESAAKGNDGQIQAIILGMVPGRDKLDIIDGFHRFVTFFRQGRETIYGTILEVTEEELLDKRIQNTINHSGLQFARATQWVRDAWSLHHLSDRLEVSSAFTLGRTKNSKGTRLGLVEGEVKDIMQWVDAKSALWGLEPLTIYAYLRTDETVDADLVKNSRPDPNQAANGTNSLPQSTLRRIGRQIPGRSDVQRAVAKVITDQRLGGSGITGILRDVKGMDDEEAIEYLQSVDYGAYKERISAKPVYRYTEDDILRLERIRDSSRVRPLAEIAALTTIHVEMVLEEGGFDQVRLEVARKEIEDIASQLSETSSKICSALSGETTVHESDAKGTAPRSFEEFTNALTEFVMDSWVPLEITTEREARAAERALERGRGKQLSLVRLREKVDKFRSEQST